MSMHCKIHFDVLEHATVRTDAISFLPDPTRASTGTLAVFAPGYTSEKSSLLSWGTGLAALGVPVLIFDLPGHYLGNLHPLSSFEEFKSHTPHLFARGLEVLTERAPERARDAYHVVLGGHSLGALMAADAMSLPRFSPLARMLVGVGLGASPENGKHIFETELYRQTLDVRQQLVAPCLAPDRIIPWIKEDKANLSLAGETVFLLTGKDDLVAAPSSVARLEDVLRRKRNLVTTKVVRRLPHHQPDAAATHICNHLKKVLELGSLQPAALTASP